MNFLANVPIWAYFVIMAITFMFMHVVAYDPHRVSTRGAGATTTMRIGSSVILLIGLLVMQPALPVTLLLALLLAALGGFLSGRAAPPPRRADGGGSVQGGKGRVGDGENGYESGADADTTTGTEQPAGDSEAPPEPDANRRE